MSATDFYAALGVELPAAGREATVRCFDPDAHKHEDRRPSCLVNRHSGCWSCQACGMRGGPYHAALALGRSPADAMALVDEHGLDAKVGVRPLVQPRTEELRAAYSAPGTRAFRTTEIDVARYHAALLENHAVLERLGELRGWTREAIERLEVGLDERGKITFPHRDSAGVLVGLSRHQPNPKRREGPKVMADSGSTRELVPPPETLPEDETNWLFEGEPDAVAGTSFGFAASAVPGAGKWRAEWAERFADRRVVVCMDCDEAGRKAAVRIAEALAPHAAEVKLIDLEGNRDDGYDVGDLLQEASLNGGAHHARVLLERIVADTEPIQASIPPDARATVQHLDEGLLHAPRILDRLRADLARAGLVGEDDAAGIIFLATTSRLLDKPVSVAVKGPSAGGKSFLVETVLAFFPESASYALTGMSERALAYSQEPLEHRMIVIYEAAGMTGEFATYLLRSLLSEGAVRYETVEKTKDGMRARLIERPGPTGLIVTTTQVRLHPENETRLLSIPVTDTPEQTKSVMLAIAGDERPGPDLLPWIALQHWIAKDNCGVVVPYARELAKLVPPAAVRLRRDFAAVLGLVCAHALLHRATREADDQGRVIATLDDYAVVRGLVNKLVSDGIGATVRPETRETVGATVELAGDHPDGVPQSALIRRLKLDRSAVSRRVRVALEGGYLRNLEDRKGRPHRLVVGDPLPEDIDILPTVEELGDCCTVARPSGGIDQRG